jgi:hypothetical protein
MATANDIVRRALRACGVLDAHAETPAREGTDALGVLNALLAEWYEAEVGLPEYTLAALTTTTVLDAADREAVALQLAKRIAGEYGYAISPQDEANAISAWSRLALRYFQPTPAITDLPSPAYRFNVETGE